MNFGFFLFSCMLVTGEEPAVLDAFHYRDAKAATTEWTPQGDREVSVFKTQSGGGIELALPFAVKPSLERVTIDRKVRFDLSGRREFTLDLEPDDMVAVGEVTLYFKSGEGWYGCGSGLRRPGPQTLRFARTSFRSEGRPAGWEHVDGIRIAVWRGMGENSSLRLRRLAAWEGRAKIVEPVVAVRVIDPAHEVRAFWNHSGTGAYPGDWERTAKALEEGRFTMILPNQLWAGRADYPSKVLPRSENFRKYGDQVAQCVAAAHRHGLQVHVWKVNFNLGNAPRESVEKLRREGRTQVSVGGKATNWLCPSHPENFKFEVDTMVEVARMYPVDGLHFDYIRYPDGEHCYCDGCRKRFEADSGKPVAEWPGDCYHGSRRDEYRTWRCRQITRVVEAVSREAKRVRPGIKISAAVFGGYPSCRQTVGQDWVAWVKAGYLDFICPMDYSASDDAFADLVASQVYFVGGRVPIYAGIGATAVNPPMTAPQVLRQIEKARSLGASGFSIFNLDGKTIETLVPEVGKGLKRAKGKD
ncbi:MAG: family 10 glycosylhydrolase [Thermoguttaceae bacterium]|jgi:uncharacterized lipoprotein YddW (UPF0748 family)